MGVADDLPSRPVGLAAGLDWPRMLDLFADAAAVVDDELVLLEVNAVMCAQQQARREDLNGTRLTAYEVPGHRGLHHEFSQLKAGEIRRGETQLQRADGSVIDVEFTATVLSSGLNMVVLRDMTAFRTARESELAESRALGAAAQLEISRGVLDASVDAYIGLDADGHVLEWNRAAFQMFGWTTEEATGQPLTELVVTADQRESVLQDMRHYAITGQPELVGHVSAHRMRRNDGTELPVELTVTAIGSGPQLRFHVFIRDMSALSAAQAALRGSDATFEAVFANAPIGIALRRSRRQLSTGQLGAVQDHRISRAGTDRADLPGHHTSG